MGPGRRVERIDQLVGSGLEGPRRGVWGAPETPDEPADVRVDRGDRAPEGDRRDGPSRVRPDAWQGLEDLDVSWDPAGVPFDDRLGRTLELDRTPVVAEARPRPQHVRGGREGARPGRREPLDERSPGALYP